MIWLGDPNGPSQCALLVPEAVYERLIELGYGGWPAACLAALM